MFNANYSLIEPYTLYGILCMRSVYMIMCVRVNNEIHSIHRKFHYLTKRPVLNNIQEM